MFGGSIFLGNYVPLISVGAITRAVEVRINPIFDNSLTELDSEVKRETKDTVAAPHNTTQHDYDTTIEVLLHVTPQDHGMADTRVATLESGACTRAFSRLALP